MVCFLPQKNGIQKFIWQMRVSLRSKAVYLVVSNIFYFHPYLGKSSNLTNIFQMGWFNHQLVMVGRSTLEHTSGGTCQPKSFESRLGLREWKKNAGRFETAFGSKKFSLIDWEGFVSLPSKTNSKGMLENGWLTPNSRSVEVEGSEKVFKTRSFKGQIRSRTGQGLVFSVSIIYTYNHCVPSPHVPTCSIFSLCVVWHPAMKGTKLIKGCWVYNSKAQRQRTQVTITFEKGPF